MRNVFATLAFLSGLAVAVAFLVNWTAAYDRRLKKRFDPQGVMDLTTYFPFQRTHYLLESLSKSFSPFFYMDRIWNPILSDLPLFSSLWRVALSKFVTCEVNDLSDTLRYCGTQEFEPDHDSAHAAVNTNSKRVGRRWSAEMMRNFVRRRRQTHSKEPLTLALIPYDTPPVNTHRQQNRVHTSFFYPPGNTVLDMNKESVFAARLKWLNMNNLPPRRFD
ncbi:hypothetical protein NDA11_000346 [Ustilago hordei]|uniref:Uncharacterized protein n=1 Tax=Ustilago hordei TaxID=120017 RepID=I2G163_USTHO|nr:uncharacterized protein UHO2_03341 [Ustilago hordei]KAJ1040997.1 hypothetical protein NDA10_000102 [Ustilago hordei]KAJ1581253.1 hypothetical protein NDA15_007597 [Ustilago hordei]KAJ1582679.1 hypothetical protein NDA12_000836 [Ustilago hordei]KAJ1588498.1 hypothetical protein NDA11_000346 [Ustilago hordei]KAJ1599996.1 hypothetical protein NDA14_006733 [Ustilago hordei]